ILAILKSGGAYVPLDPDYPRERLAFLVEDAGAPVVLTQRALVGRLPATEARVLCLDEEEPGPRPAASLSRRAARPDHAAYVIYTSGSTGRPKGVVVTHANVVRLLRATEAWFGFDQRDVWTLFHSFAFDFSVWELWGALAYGGRLVVVPYEVSRSPEALLDLLAAEGVTVLNQTPSAFRQLIQAGETAGPRELALRYVIFGGEALELQSLRPWFDRHGDERPRLVNMYGITETTVHATYRPLGRPDLDAGRGSVIGRPIPDLRIHLLDRQGQPVPVGVPGEIHVGGAGLARAYHRRAALTAERFVPDGLAGEAGARLYRSGDLARWLADGELEYLGRGDDQVKVRGFRVETGEIAAALRRHESVRECLVVAREDPGDAPHERRLVAYVVPAAGEQPRPGELRAWLKSRLPEYMVPSAFVALDRLPLTAHGKVDRRALPPPASARPDVGAVVAPRSPVEEALAALWCEALGLDEVGVEDSFFDLGGHSLLAVKLVARIREAFGVELPVRAVFTSPTVAALARELAEADASAPEPPLVAVPRGGALPLSFMQERLWFLDRYEPGSAAFNMPLAVRVRGPLEPQRLRSALEALVARHESLRVRFPSMEGAPAVVIAPPPAMALPVTELSALAPAEGEKAAAQEAEREAAAPFDLATGPLVRARLLRLSSQDHVLLLTVHHAVADGWSLGILAGELGPLYEALGRGQEPTLPELSLQYADYAAWERQRLQGARMERQLDYWRERLAGAPAQTELPADRPRPRVQTYHGQRLSRTLEAELVGGLHALSRSQGVTPFMALLAAFAVLVSRWSGQEDLVVGAPVAGRPRRELEGVVGPFLNTVALRVALAGNPTFLELLGRVREAALGAYQHQEVPFEKVLEALQPARDLARTPLFQLFFNMLTFPAPAAELAGLRFAPLSRPDVPSKFDLTVYAAENAGRVELELVYNTDLFDRARIAELAEQYEGLLRSFALDPGQPILRPSLVTAAARSLLPDPRAPLDDRWQGAIHEHLSGQAARVPDKVAVADRNETWSYAELEAASNRLARHLRGRSGGRGAITAIYAHRSGALVWAVMGGLKTGGAVLVLDPAYPGPSLVERLDLARPRALVGLRAAGPLPAAVEQWLGRHPECARIELPCRPGPADPWAGESAAAPAVAVGPDDAACISFTSGSTGVPKGIVGLHRSLTHFVPWQQAEFGLGEADRFSLLSGLAHDPLQRDVFTAVQLGATICVPEPERMGEPGYLARWAAEQVVSVAHLTPAMAQLLSEAPAGLELKIESLRAAFIVGDVLTRHDVQRMRALAPNVRCVNLFGATETQRAVGYHVVEEGAPGARSRQALPLGRGVADTQLLVLNAAGELAGIGEVGEVVVRSPHLAGGYLGDAELSRRKFVVNPFTRQERDRVYRTGDLGRYLPGGEVEWVGRADRQVKVRGFRIEPG
ncbi:MAG: amino acid adenylation domain-containing protein, partial [Thermoanaerobaculia bacterium]